MTGPEPDQPSGSASPAPPTGEDEVPPVRLGVVFWLLIVFGLLCVLGGGAIAAYGPRLFPPPVAGRPGQHTRTEPAAPRMALGAQARRG